jgi:hypothetical protein
VENLTPKDAYKQGFIDGLACYAWWKDGIQFVGTTGMTLKEATKEVEKQWNYYGNHLYNRP